MQVALARRRHPRGGVALRGLGDDVPLDTSVGYDPLTGALDLTPTGPLDVTGSPVGTTLNPSIYTDITGASCLLSDSQANGLCPGSLFPVGTTAAPSSGGITIPSIVIPGAAVAPSGSLPGPAGSGFATTGLAPTATNPLGQWISGISNQAVVIGGIVFVGVIVLAFALKGGGGGRRR